VGRQTSATDSGGAPARLFTARYTCADGVDHAITDEEFFAHRPEPEAVCGDVVVLAAMEAAPGPLCAGCRAVLQGAATLPAPRTTEAPLRSVASTLRDAFWLSPFGWTCPRTRPTGVPANLFRASSETAVSPTGDRTEPPAGGPTRIPAGVPAGEGTTGSLVARVPSPAQVVSDTVSVTGGRLAVQQQLPERTAASVAGVGLGGSQNAEASKPRHRVPLAAGVPAPGSDQRHTPIPAGAALSAASPEGRDPDRQDASARPRRVLVIHPWTPVARDRLPRA
jgi:hypothetical protein